MKYTIGAVYWVFHNYPTLSNGKWPDPKIGETGRHDKGTSYRAPYENPCILAAEVARRVRYCGTDGMIAELVYGMLLGVTWGVNFYCREYHLDPKNIKTKINNVAWYCTDEEFEKELTYDAWKVETHGNRKIRTAATGRVGDS